MFYEQTFGSRTVNLEHFRDLKVKTFFTTGKFNFLGQVHNRALNCDNKMNVDLDFEVKCGMILSNQT